MGVREFLTTCAAAKFVTKDEKRKTNNEKRKTNNERRKTNNDNENKSENINS